MNADQPQGPVWRKASASGVNGCIEVAPGSSGAVKIRDSKNPDGQILTCSGSAWQAFLSASRTGELDGLSVGH